MTHFSWFEACLRLKSCHTCIQCTYTIWRAWDHRIAVSAEQCLHMLTTIMRSLHRNQDGRWMRRVKSNNLARKTSSPNRHHSTFVGDVSCIGMKMCCLTCLEIPDRLVLSLKVKWWPPVAMPFGRENRVRKYFRRCQQCGWKRITYMPTAKACHRESRNYVMHAFYDWGTVAPTIANKIVDTSPLPPIWCWSTLSSGRNSLVGLSIAEPTLNPGKGGE